MIAFLFFMFKLNAFIIIFAVFYFMNKKKKDYHAERDYLFQNVYPKLKSYCKTTHGLDFQVNK
jgi:hypothetical protein